MKQILFFLLTTIPFFYSCVLDSQDGQETFVVSKKSLYHKSSGHLKEELAVLLEELAHLTTRQIQLLAQSQQQLLHRMRELVDGDSKGLFSSASHKRLQQGVHDAHAMVAEAQKNVQHLTKFFNFLQGA